MCDTPTRNTRSKTEVPISPKDERTSLRKEGSGRLSDPGRPGTLRVLCTSSGLQGGWRSPSVKNPAGGVVLFAKAIVFLKASNGLALETNVMCSHIVILETFCYAFLQELSFSFSTPMG